MRVRNTNDRDRGSEDNYPPCNVERLGEDRYRISLALAGFAPDEIAITAEQNVLTVEGRKAEKAQREFLYQGISSRPFKRQFNLADYVQVKGAAFDNGLLQIELVREIPEAMKPRRIAINGSPASNVQQIETRRPDRRHSADYPRPPRRVPAAEAHWCLVPGLPDAWTRCILRLAAR